MATLSLPTPKPTPASLPSGSPGKPPAYRRHSSGQARVTIDGTAHYLGVHGTPESWEAYHRLIAEWMAHGGTVRLPPAARASLTICELCAAFWEHAERYYRNAAGESTRETPNFRLAMRPLRRLFDLTPAADFGPNALRLVREEMIRMGWCRKMVNKQVHRIKHIFKWAAGHELVPASVWHGLQAVEGLARGRTPAPEPDAIRPVPMEFVTAIQPHVSRQVWALVQLQLCTGARAGELVRMRAVDIDTAGDVWRFQPREHKTAWHGHARTILIGPRGQAVLRPYLANRALDAFLFSPEEAEAERRAEVHAARVTPPHQGNAIGTNRKVRPQRKAGSHYDTASYRRAISRACILAADAAFPPPAELEGEARSAWVRKHRETFHWHPHQLRHNAATSICREEGVEVARIILGHRHVQTTELYAEADFGKAAAVMRRVG